ncbi:glycoside hydrolase family 3 N-terminal domain-containing protein [Streptomyces sp. AC495_CC817]|uniref:glycoside hydrolase family 3 N-terminal domain-containing protein n=1 Tax=Streptomyces sp. AC495_CC817 TaxID=2823900 RepID=UPI001C272004|nr:glycoside hydrolase family 3 N-terminal domain-containing protein [Streptomyces sp. AC495_CC817]
MSDDLTRLANSVLWPGFFGTRAPEWLLTELRHGLAGVVYFGQNVSEDLPLLSAEIRDANPAALIGIDEEGGSVTRLETGTGSTLPGAAQLGAIDDIAATTLVGAELARRVTAIGANVVLGPVADVNTNPQNPVIGVRAFGSDDGLVSRHAVAMTAGIQGAGAAACVKHFPGHGDTNLDSHHSLPVIGLDTEEFERVHLAPFVAAVDAGVDMVMTAHIVVPEWGDAPATLNPAILGRLRAMGFTGVIVTDALDMAAIRESIGIGEGAVRALAAGADLLCIGNPTNPGAAMLPDQDERDFHSARDAIVRALADGTLPVARVREAAARNAALAAKLASSPAPAADAPGFDDLALRALAVSGTVPETSGPLFVVDSRRRPTLAVDSSVRYLVDVLRDGGASVRVDPDDADTGVPAVPADATAVLLVDRPALTSVQRTVAEGLRDAGVPGVIVNVGFPSHAEAPLPVIDVRAASRIGANAALARIRGLHDGR